MEQDRDREVPTYVKWALAFAFTLGALVLASYMWQVALVAFLGVIFSIVVDALARLVARSGLPRGVAVVVSAALIIAAFVGALGSLGAPILAQGSEFAEGVPEKLERLRGRLDELRVKYPVLTGVLPADRDEDGKATKGPTPVAAAKAVAITASHVLQGLWLAVAAVILGTFLALQPDLYLRGAARLLPGATLDDRIDLLERIGAGLRSWLLALACQILVTAVVISTALSLVGIPYALFFGCLSGTLEVVPYLGPLVGLVPPVVVASGRGPGSTIAVLAIYAALHVVEGYILVPLVLKKREQLPPALVILSIMAFSGAFGILGIVLAVPLGMVVYVSVRHAVLAEPRRAPLKIVVSREPTGEKL